jgi:hypothetical protein
MKEWRVFQDVSSSFQFPVDKDDETVTDKQDNTLSPRVKKCHFRRLRNHSASVFFFSTHAIRGMMVHCGYRKKRTSVQPGSRGAVPNCQMFNSFVVVVVVIYCGGCCCQARRDCAGSPQTEEEQVLLHEMWDHGRGKCSRSRNSCNNGWTSSGASSWGQWPTPGNLITRSTALYRSNASTRPPGVHGS